MEKQNAQAKEVHSHWGQLFLELFSYSYDVELELSFQNSEFTILGFKILDFQILNSGFWQVQVVFSPPFGRCPHSSALFQDVPSRS